MLPQWPGHSNLQNPAPGGQNWVPNTWQTGPHGSGYGGWGNATNIVHGETLYERREILYERRGNLFERREQNERSDFGGSSQIETNVYNNYAAPQSYTHQNASDINPEIPMQRDSEINHDSRFASSDINPGRPMQRDSEINHDSRFASSASTSQAPPNPATKLLCPLPNSDVIVKKLVEVKARLTESPLPKEFDTLVTQLSCKLCGVTSPEPKYMKPHWGSILHKDEVRNWLEEWFEKMRSTDSDYQNRPKAYEFEEDEECCFVCMKPFMNANMASDHYNSKHHERRVINLLFDLAMSKYHNLSQFRCDICNVTSATKQQLNVHLDSTKHAKALRNLGMAVEIPVPVHTVDSRNQMKFECEICNIKTNTEEMLKIHMTSKKHLKRLKMLSGDGIIDAQGISGPSNIFTYSCDICNVKAETGEQLKCHLSSKKHKSALGKKKSDLVKKEVIVKVETRDVNPWEYKCDICKVTANNHKQYIAHIEGGKHKKAVAREEALAREEAAQINNKETAAPIPKTSTKKRKRLASESEEKDGNALKKPMPSDAVAQFLSRYQFLVQSVSVPQYGDCDAARTIVGACGEMAVVIVPGEYLWHTLQRNSNIWSKPLSCSLNVVQGDNADVWRVTVTFDKVRGIAESPEMVTSRIAAGELLLHKLQQMYYSIIMPKDVFEKIENYENFDDEEEEEEDAEDEFGLNNFKDDTLNYESSDEEEEKLDTSNIYFVDKKKVTDKVFEDMVDFYLQDYQVNVEDFRELVFINFCRYERLSIREKSAEYGIAAEYRRGRTGIVVQISKVKTLYKNDIWTFVKVMLLYKNKHFRKWELVKPGNTVLCKYNSVKYIDDEEKKVKDENEDDKNRILRKLKIKIEPNY